MRWDWRILSALGRFISYYMFCSYNLRETALDRFLLRIPPKFSGFEVFHVFRFEEEPIFSYKAQVLIDDADTVLWVMNYTKRVVLVCVALIFSAYGEY